MLQIEIPLHQRRPCHPETKDTQLKYAFLSWKLRCSLAFFIAIMLIPVLGRSVLAYDRGRAVTYADNWALGRNPIYPSYGDDCTNFVSQALYAGGYRMVPGDGNHLNDNNWYLAYGPPWVPTRSWVNASDQYTFQIWHSPGGYWEAAVSSSDNAYWNNFDAANMFGGDVLFYNWDGSSKGITHAAFQVNAGYSQYYPSSDPNPWYGDLSDQHVTDRLQVSWSHIEVNAQWPTTIITEVHIDGKN